MNQKQPSRTTERAHIERLRRKHDRLQMLRALIFMWENKKPLDHKYIKELHRKSEKLQNEINVMAI